MRIGLRIAERRKAKGLSQGELARRADLSQPTIGKLEAGISSGSSALHRIARALDTTPAYLTGETDDPTADAPDLECLSRDEVQWVAYWRVLNEDEKRTMVDLIELLMANRGQGAPMAKAA